MPNTETQPATVVCTMSYVSIDDIYTVLKSNFSLLGRRTKLPLHRPLQLARKGGLLKT